MNLIFIMLTSAGIFEDPEMKQSDRVRTAIRKYFQESEGQKLHRLTLTVITFPEKLPTGQTKAGELLSKAKENRADAIVLYSDPELDAVAQQLADLCGDKEKAHPRIFRVSGKTLEEVAA